jgi:hypothetical protein
LGWRVVYLVFAGMNLFVCLPVHAWIATFPRKDRQPHAAVATANPAGVEDRAVSTVMALMLAGFLVEGLVISAVLVHMVPMLDKLGLAATGIFVTTLFGPSQVLSRFINMAFGGRLRQTTLAIIAATLLPSGLLVLLATAPSIPGALAFAVLFGLGSGLTSIVGGTLPLELFGHAGYGVRLGWISSARLFSSALAPSALALMFAGFGTFAALWTVAAVGGLGIGTFLLVAMLAAPRQVPVAQ